jgi:2-keto-3-deoxy-L-rhamnonate aldolase RhmA
MEAELTGKQLRERLAAGQRVYGTCVEGFGNPRWPRLFSRLGLDFVFMDNEHNPLDRETCAWAAQAYAANNVAPLLRIPEPSATLAAMAVDLGAHGVIVPYVETVEQVRHLVGAVKYRPLKGAALGQWVQEAKPINAQTAVYLERFNPEAVLVIMIESAEGVARLPELLMVKGVDVVFVGPHDFSVSHGVPEQFDHPVFEAALRETIRICSARGVAVGVHHLSGSDERERKWIEWGCTFISHKSDTMLIAEGILNEIGTLRESFGDGLRPQDVAWPIGPSQVSGTTDTW